MSRQKRSLSRIFVLSYFAVIQAVQAYRLLHLFPWACHLKVLKMWAKSSHLQKPRKDPPEEKCAPNPHGKCRENIPANSSTKTPEVSKGTLPSLSPFGWASGKHGFRHPRRRGRFVGFQTRRDVMSWLFLEDLNSLRCFKLFCFEVFKCSKVF